MSEPVFSIFGKIVSEQEWNDYHEGDLGPFASLAVTGTSDNPFAVTAYFHDEDDLMPAETSYTRSSSGRSRYVIDGREVSFDEWNQHLAEHKRVGREQRDRYLDHLSNMYAEEYLDSEEYGRRASLAAEAKYEADLTSLVKDLPLLPPAPAPVHVPEPVTTGKEPAKAVEACDVTLPHPFRKHLHPDQHLTTWSFAGLCASLASFIPADMWAATAYHGLGNSPVGFALLTVFGGIVALIALVCTVASLVIP